ncbi:MAG TPA: hydrogenase maturation nickel metallochaperone HypA [Terrimicrobiaceae bacterium]|nr:hydrogenase maturation nickel metallochaperone HypA [Terrimicrobiaceae bacterium]
MHELSIASAIVEHVAAFAESLSPPRKVLSVRVVIGELTCLEPEQLKFCYDAITKETSLEDSLLEIERAEAEVFCPHCSYRGRPKFWEEALSDVAVATMQCPSCGGVVEATQGHDCVIRTVRYVE